MLRMILSGCHGRMGQKLVQFCARRSDVAIVAGLDRLGRPAESFPVFSDPAHCTVPAHVLIDFSKPDALNRLLALCLKRKLPIIVATTGHSPRQQSQIELASHTIPVFYAANLSVGAYMLQALVGGAMSALGPGFSVSIIERHHADKTDAPSGTALMLSALVGSTAPVFSIRAGTTAGEHTVLFAGDDEVLKLTHEASSRDVYAAGAIRAARFLTSVGQPGLYEMKDLLSSPNAFSDKMWAP